jgi:predicted O-linked N-acetylglucosamine transferase (SPINDLY family)
MSSVIGKNLLLQQATALHQEGQLDAAETIYLTLLQSFPANANLITNLGTIAYQRGQYETALNWLDQSLQLSFYQPIALNSRGNALEALDRLPEAFSNYECAISLDPAYVQAHYNKANCLQKLHNFAKALQSYDKAIALKPDYAEAFSNRGVVFDALKRSGEALASYQQAIELKPSFADAYYNQGNALLNLKRYEEALASYQKAIDLNSNYIDAYYNQGNTLINLKRYEEALASYQKAIELNPNYAEAFLGRAQAYFNLRQFNLALASCEQAIVLKPDATTYLSRGQILFELMMLEEALLCYGQAIALDSEYGLAYFNRGVCLKLLMRNEEALLDFECAAKSSEELPLLSVIQMNINMHLCSWVEFTSHFHAVIEKINVQNEESIPFAIQALTDQLSVHKQVAQRYIEVKCPINTKLSPITPYPIHQKLRIVYISADFKSHPVAQLTAELYDLHNRDQFEIIAFSIGPNTRDEMRQRFEASFDGFYDVQAFSDEEVALFARVLQTDIVVDLTGHTALSRPGIFALRAAPIQVNYLGYPGTFGADYMDYIIADKVLIPEDKQSYYVEKVVYMPGSYMVTNSQVTLPINTFTREILGLPATGFVFCCFNQSYKILPDVFSCWMRILNQVDGSVLWLSHSNATAIKNLKAEAVKQGVQEHRLIFSERMPSVEEHLNRIQLADLFLDTLPFNAHTTASDALRMGLPVLTRMGESFASRVAASLLNAVNLPELVAANSADYEALAIELATQPDKLAAIKTKLLTNLPTAPLYNTPLFTQHLESAYKMMYQRYHDGLEPEHIYVEH